MATIGSEAGLISALQVAKRRIYFKNAITPKGAGIACTPWYTAGTPRAGATPASGLSGGVCSNTTQGALSFPTPSGATGYHYGMVPILTSGSAGDVVRLIDRVWQNSGIVVTTTTAQTVNSVAFPARDLNNSTNGDGYRIALEVSAATTNGAAISGVQVSYTNSDGVSGRVATLASNNASSGFPATATAGSFLEFALQAGDVGVRSIQSITLGTSLVTGTVHLVVYRNIQEITTEAGTGAKATDWQSVGLPKRSGSECLQMLIIPIAASSRLLVAVVTQGEF